MAGHDVLAITLRAIFYYLARSPRVLSKLRIEIDTVIKDYPLSSPTSSSQIASLFYLQVHPFLQLSSRLY